MAGYLGIEASDVKPYIFISYNTEDQERLCKIMQMLQKHPINIWYDNGIKRVSDEGWQKQIALHIRDAEIVFFFISRGIFMKENSYVRKEYNLAVIHRKNICVVLLDEIDARSIPAEYDFWWDEVIHRQCIEAVKMTYKQIADAIYAECYKIEAAKDAKHDIEEINNSADGDKVSIFNPFIGAWEKYAASDFDYQLSTPEDAFEFSVNDNRCSVESLRDKKYTIIKIPEKYHGKPVTAIGNDAFAWCKSLTNITIPSGVTTIGYDAFAWCESLRSVTIPSSVTTIRNGAFKGCKSLENVTIPFGVTNIGNETFQWCGNLTSVAIPSSVTFIGNSAFMGCESLISVAIPSSVTIIGARAFYRCKSLTSVTIPSSVTINKDVFGGCPKLISISGGTVAGNGRTTTGTGGIATGTDMTESTVIYAPMNGTAVKLADVPDKNFASGMLGLGVAIDPTEGKLYAPFDGTIICVAEAKHAYGIRNAAGAEVLIHIGVYSGRLKGKYFIPKIVNGQQVRKGDLLAEFNISAIKKEYKMFSPVILVDAEDYSFVEIVKDSGPVKVGDVLFYANIKR